MIDILIYSLHAKSNHLNAESGDKSADTLTVEFFRYVDLLLECKV